MFVLINASGREVEFDDNDPHGLELKNQAFLDDAKRAGAELIKAGAKDPAVLAVADAIVADCQWSLKK